MSATPSVYDIEIDSLESEPGALKGFQGKTALIVNVASKCGFTPQYEALQRIHDAYADRGFSVVGVPCNQFGGQEPGSSDEIREFCSLTYGVTFPLTEKVEVNGPDRHPLFELLTGQPDAEGNAGDVQWNFEKFLVSPEGEVVARWRTGVEPDDEQVVADIERVVETDRRARGRKTTA